jgi:hypothetical protein
VLAKIVRVALYLLIALLAVLFIAGCATGQEGLAFGGIWFSVPFLIILGQVEDHINSRNLDPEAPNA